MEGAPTPFLDRVPLEEPLFHDSAKQCHLQNQGGVQKQEQDQPSDDASRCPPGDRMMETLESLGMLEGNCRIAAGRQEGSPCRECRKHQNWSERAAWEETHRAVVRRAEACREVVQGPPIAEVPARS